MKAHLRRGRRQWQQWQRERQLFGARKKSTARRYEPKILDIVLLQVHAAPVESGRRRHTTACVVLRRCGCTP